MAESKLVLEFVKVLIWPLTAILLLLVYREAITELLPSAKITVKIFGVELNLTPRELKSVTSVLVDGRLNKKQLELLEELGNGKIYSVKGKGFDSDKDWKWIRPLMFAGLIGTHPKFSYKAKKIKGLVATPLGELLIENLKHK